MRERSYKDTRSKSRGDDRTVAASIAVDRICGMKEPRRVTFISREGAF